MSLLRTTAARSLRSNTAVFGAMRGYAAGPGGSDAGATANASSYKNREAAEESNYIRQQEQDKLKKLRESLAKQREHLDQVERDINALGGQDGQKK
ncbi:unnamed protein product [Parajaminaea phylloscopi]